ncbi:hypothetical protein NDU88_004264 [Pleurodeles waltl]|uniref:Uncharacterized protein n=1 Tax=Pleurodeles waltl TaxID=8319 RepID=A0AAV7LHT6_PLEWA|nr:hypothetical protein NDU88_004264 [Pleurodeles waltl]
MVTPVKDIIMKLRNIRAPATVESGAALDEPGAPAVPMPLAWALQGPPGAPRQPIPPSCSWRENRQEQGGGMGCQNPHGGAASCAAMEDSNGQRKTGGRPPVFRI